MKVRQVLMAALFLLGAAALAWTFEDQAVVEWIGAHAVRLQTPEAGHGFADIEPLKKIVGNARIVSLGEATHGTREFFQLKHRMLEFLASEMGFTIFSIEANMPEAYRLNDFVLTGNGDPAKLIRGMYFWTWDTQEVLDMVLWMREFNKSGKGRVEFTGFDMQTPNVAVEIVRDFVAKADPDYAASLRQASELALATAPAQPTGSSFGVATGSFPVKVAAGKRARFSGYIKTESVTNGYAGLWWRVDGASGVLAFANLEDRAPKGTTDWKRYELEIPVAADAKNINFGALLSGEGTAWFDGLTVELNGEPYLDKSLFDLDFESPSPRGFFTGGDGYQVQLDSQVFHSGKQSLRMKYAAAAPRPRPTGQKFGVATGSFPVKDAAGKRVRFSGYIKTESVTNGYAGLWWRVDGTSGSLAFANLEGRAPTGTTDWKRYELEIPVAAEARNINFGALLAGDGTAWFDGLAIELDGKPYVDTSVFDLDFESPSPKGFSTGGDEYQVQLDNQVFHSGKQSLRMKHVAAAPNDAKSADPKAAASRWKEVVRHMEASREQYGKKSATAREIEWAIQNARVVLQCMELRANEVTRDRSMADNVKWILDHSPDAKIVLWAHNGHVTTEGAGGYEPMGAWLRKMFGDQMVVFGFAFNQGSFQAISQGRGLRDFTVPPAPAGSFDATLAATGIPLFALDLRQAPKSGPVAAWLSAPHDTRSIGALYSEDTPNGFMVSLTAPRCFDAVLFVEKTTAARKNPGR